MRLTTIGVFCASSDGADARYREAAGEMGRLLASAGRRIVYGGGRTGLMGALAEAAMAAGGEVIGLMPRHLVDREVAHHQITRLEVMDTMHARKARLAELVDAFVALPGGLGTVEEFTEIWTWAQLGLHAKPYGLLNVLGYYDGLLAFLDGAVSQGFVRPEHRAMVQVATDPAALIAALESAPPPARAKYVDGAGS
ncbi:MAG TPA: TIGR00730 family Rossman fold protein [Gemmatimonadaceae bacterium]|nr:TIGR00730 family Rossman fold protein [Gemmatimonadaceae bacterium]